ncbi:MAG: hypothetical protein P1V97_21425 [Planctomycetota bacterium]|nr:hypothetical protein [Planctomycetota bacterium]
MAITQIENHADQLELLFSDDPDIVAANLCELRQKQGLSFHTLPVLIHLIDQKPVSHHVGTLTRTLLSEFQSAVMKQPTVEEQLRGFDGLVAQTLSAQSQSERAVAAAELGNQWWRYPVSVWALKRACKDSSALVREVAGRILAIVLERHHAIETQSLEEFEVAVPPTDVFHSLNQRLSSQEKAPNRKETTFDPVLSSKQKLRKPKARRGFQGVRAVHDHHWPCPTSQHETDAVEDLIEQMKESDSSRSLHAMTCIAQLGSNGQKAIPELCEQLRSTDVKRRVWAAYSLGSLGQSASSALPSLSLAYWDDDRRVRDAVRGAQSKIRGHFS